MIEPGSYFSQATFSGATDAVPCFSRENNCCIISIGKNVSTFDTHVAQAVYINEKQCRSEHTTLPYSVCDCFFGTCD